MLIARERLHVESHFCQQHLGHAVIDAGDGVQPLDLSRERARVLLDFGVQLGERRQPGLGIAFLGNNACGISMYMICKS